MIPRNLQCPTFRVAHDLDLGWEVKWTYFRMPGVVRLHQAILRVLDAWHLWPSLVWGFALLYG